MEEDSGVEPHPIAPILGSRVPLLWLLALCLSQSMIARCSSALIRGACPSICASCLLNLPICFPNSLDSGYAPYARITTYVRYLQQYGSHFLPKSEQIWKMLGKVILFFPHFQAY